MAVSSLSSRQEARVTKKTTASERVEWQAIRIWCRLIIFTPTRMRWAARAAMGMKLNTGVAKSRTNSTTTLLSMEDSWETAPLWKLTAERAKEEDPGTAPNRAQA